RHRALSSPARPLPEGELTAAADELDGVVARDDFSQLLAHLSTVHPSRYGRMVDGIDAAVWEDVTTIENESVALSFVALVDRLYDRNVHIINSGAPLDEIFTEDSLAGGYRKKYMRCLSRLTALSSCGPTRRCAGPPLGSPQGEKFEDLQIRHPVRQA